MGLMQITPPDAAAEIVSLSLVKKQLRVPEDITDEDELIQGLISSAREVCESRSWRALAVQTFELTLPCFPFGGDGLAILMPRPPLREVLSITYVGEDGADVVMPEADYTVLSVVEPGRILPVNGWPVVTPREAAVRIRYVAGYFPPLIPHAAKVAVQMLVANYFENRGDEAKGVVEIPFGVRTLIRSFECRDKRLCVSLDD